MKVLLQHNVPHLGRAGDVKDVRDGFARNYLIPQGLATFASSEALARVQQQKNSAEKSRQKEFARVQALAGTVGKLTVTISAKATPEGTLFGSIHREQIVQALAEKGIMIETQSIHIPEPIKMIGSHAAEIHLNFGIKTRIHINVIPQ